MATGFLYKVRLLSVSYRKALKINQDCAYENGSFNPKAVESCTSLDDDCDEEIDEDAVVQTWYLDVYGDGFGDVNQAIQSCDMPESLF